MERSLRIAAFYVFSLLFVVLNAYLLFRGKAVSFLLPLAVAGLALYLFRLDAVLPLIAFATPLSFYIDDYELGTRLSIPAELLLIAATLFFVIKMLFQNNYDRKILKHPVTRFIFLNLAWILITSLTSTMPAVSFKFLAARLWFVIPAFFMGAVLFRDISRFRQFYRLHGIALAIVVIYTTIMHAGHGFNEEVGHWIMWPFYNDHTAYGMILALSLPLFIGFIFDKSQTGIWRFAAVVISAILFTGLYLSFSRAAWLSFAGAAVVFLLVYLKVNFKWLAAIAGVIVLTFVLYSDQIFYLLEKNEQDSSKNFTEHLKSIYNINSDASNLERINRWQSALRMYREKRLTGWGPGTYQFQYAPFQMAREKTIISTNSGNMGNAHSEYIGPLSEQGMPGMLITIALFISAFITGVRVYNRGSTRPVRMYALWLTTGLTTYFIHGFLNNFLDTDKAAVPFFAAIAMLVALDIYHGRIEPVEHE